MRFNLLPTDTTFYDLFGKSAGHLVQGAQPLTEILDTGNDRAEKARRLKDVEHRCDDVHETIRRLNSTFVTPFDREDIYRLAGGLDNVMGDMEASADYIHLYEIDELPPGVPARWRSCGMPLTVATRQRRMPQKWRKWEAP